MLIWCYTRVMVSFERPDLIFSNLFHQFWLKMHSYLFDFSQELSHPLGLEGEGTSPLRQQQQKQNWSTLPPGAVWSFLAAVCCHC